MHGDGIRHEKITTMIILHGFEVHESQPYAFDRIPTEGYVKTTSLYPELLYRENKVETTPAASDELYIDLLL